MSNTIPNWYGALGLRIRSRRHELGVTLAQAAQPLGVSWQMFQKYETGKSRLPLDKAVTVARFLRIDLHSMLGEDAHQAGNSQRHSNKT